MADPVYIETFNGKTTAIAGQVYADATHPPFPPPDSVGVYGASANGPGVEGSGGGDGVRGMTTSAAHAGVSATNDSGGFGVWARGTPGGHFESPAGDGIFGTSQQGSGVHGVASGGGAGVVGESGAGDGVRGTSSSQAHAGVSAISGAGGYGLWARGNPAVHAEASDGNGLSAELVGTAVVRRPGGGGYFAVGFESAENSAVAGLIGPGGTQVIHLSGVIGSPNNGFVAVTDAAGAASHQFKAALYVDPNGQGVIEASVKNFRVTHPTEPGMDIVYACIEGPEAAVYARGTAHLVGGAATVALPDHFTGVAASETVTVVVTPLSGDSRGLAVTSKSSREFTVKELQGGQGTYDFDWEMKAVRAGMEGYQPVRPHAEVPAIADLPSAAHG